MTEDRIITRCTYCAFVMFPEEPRVLTDFGWSHPRCLPDDFDLPA